MELISGGRPPLAPPAKGAPCASAGAALAASLDEVPLDARPNRWPATSAMSATSAIAATLHGSAFENPRWSFAPGAVPPAPAGVPHR